MEKLKAALPGLKADTYASVDKFREFLSANKIGVEYVPTVWR